MSGEATGIDARAGGVARDARQRRALEGSLVGRMRTQARERRAKRGRQPSGSRDRQAPRLTAMESPILIDVWTVEPSRRDELVQAILELLRGLVSERPGFVSAQVYESDDGGSVIASIRMRTRKERQEFTDSRDAHRGYRELRKIARSHARLYRLVESFGEPA